MQEENKKVTKEEYQSYISIREKLEDLAYDIIKYTKANYPKLLEFEEHSGLDDIIVKDNEFIIKYYDIGYDLYEYNNIAIPFERIIKNTWEKYLLEKENERIGKYVKQLNKEIEEQKERELKLLKELKEKYK